MSSKSGKSGNLDSPAVMNNGLMNLNVQLEPGFPNSKYELDELDSQDDSIDGALTQDRSEIHGTLENYVQRDSKCSKRKREIKKYF